MHHAVCSAQCAVCSMLRYQVDISALGTLEESEETDDMLKVMRCLRPSHQTTPSQHRPLLLPSAQEGISSPADNFGSNCQSAAKHRLTDDPDFLFESQIFKRRQMIESVIICGRSPGTLGLGSH